MSWSTAIIDSVADTYRYASTKFRTPRRAPPYIAAELDGLGVPYDMWKSWDDEKRQLIASRVSWIYSNVVRIGNEVSSAEFQVYKRSSKESDLEDPFEEVMRFPNEFFDGRTLLRYTIWGLSLDSWGAFWYLAPDRNTGQLREIWPIPLGRLEPVPNENKFIDHYIYTPKTDSTRRLKIPAALICRFVYAHPFNMYKSLPPLDAAGLAIDTYGGIAKTQRDLYTQSRGIPLSIISVDSNMSEPDFASVRQSLRDDWESERKIAIARAGTFDVKTLGLTSQQLQTVESSNYNRDEFDAIFMGGIQWRTDSSGDEREEINKEIKEVVIRPLHQLLASQITLQVIGRYYGKEYFGEFDDIRAQDRSILLQERNVYFRSYTFDEARADLGQPPYSHPEFEDYGELPYALATNAAFVQNYYGIAAAKDPGVEPDDVGNLPDSQDETMTVNQLATAEDADADLKVASIAITDAIASGVQEELKRYQKVLLRIWRKHENTEALLARKFDSDMLFPEIVDDITLSLTMVTSEEDIKAIFAKWLIV